MRLRQGKDKRVARSVHHACLNYNPSSFLLLSAIDYYLFPLANRSPNSLHFMKHVIPVVSHEGVLFLQLSAFTLIQSPAHQTLRSMAPCRVVKSFFPGVKGGASCLGQRVCFLTAKGSQLGRSPRAFGR